MTVTSDQLRAAGGSLRRASDVVRGIVERYEHAGRRAGATAGSLGTVWRSPEAERFSTDLTSFLAALDVIPAAATRAGEHLQGLALFADGLAEEVAGYERARSLARAREQDALRRLTFTDPTDFARVSSLSAEAREAAASQRRAESHLAAASQRWTARCRSVAQGVGSAAGELHRLTGPTIGPAPAAGPGPVAGGPGEPGTGRSAQDWVGLGWQWGASPALTLFHERQRSFVLHLEGRTTPGPTTHRALQQDVVRRGHWRNPPRVAPTSPLYGQPRPQVWVSPVLGPVRETRVTGPPVPPMRTGDVAARVPLPSDSWGRATRVLGPVGNVATVGLTGFEEYQSVTQRDDLTTGQQVANVTATTVIEGGATVGGGMAGAKGGAIGGAAIGTMIFPGVGTAIGAAGGAIIGGIGGGWIGNKVGGDISDGLKKLNPMKLFGN